jgi:hypothetical protein
MASGALTRRLRIIAVAGLCTYVGLQLAAGFAFEGADRYMTLGVAWLSMGLALMLEPSPRASVQKAALASGGAALGGALLTLAVMQVWTPTWHRSLDGLGSILVHVWSASDAVRIVVVLALAALPAPLALLLLRRVHRQLEWQAAAAALGPLLVGVCLYGGDLDKWGLLLLLLSGLPLGFGAYLLDRRFLGPAAVASFPDEPAPPAEPDGRPTPPYVVSQPAMPALTVLLGALVLGLVWAFAVARAGRVIAPSGIHPGMPELAAVFDQVVALQKEHRARTGSYARTLGALDALPLEVRGGATRGYVLRYAPLGDARWVLAADPVPTRPGWPSLRLVGPDGELERGRAPFPLKVETP